MSAPKKRGSKAGGKAAAALSLISDCPRLLAAIGNVIRINAAIESSVVVEGALAEIAKATTLDDVFLIPLRHKVVGLDGAIKFAMFLYAGSPRIIEEEHCGLPPQFDCNGAFDAMIACYDLAAQDLIWDHVEGTDEDEEEEEDEHA